MGDLTRQLTIAAPASKIFDYVVDPRNAPRYISAFNSIISGPEGAPSEGQVWQARVNFLGKLSTIDLCLQKIISGRLVRFAIEGEPQAILSIHLAPHEDAIHTGVSLMMDVPSVPGLFLNALMGGMLEGDLARLRNIMELPNEGPRGVL